MPTELRIDAKRCPLVLVGSWNQAIFSPDFVRNNVMVGIEDFEAEGGLSAGSLTLRFMGGGLTFVVNADRVAWIPAETSDPALQRVEGSAVRLLEKLSITPLAALGFNFGFNLIGAQDVIDTALSPADTDEILGALGGARLSDVTMKRSIPLENEMLNLTIGRQSGGVTAIDLNFDHKLSGAKAAIDCVTHGLVSRKKQSVELLEQVYGLKLGVS